MAGRKGRRGFGKIRRLPSGRYQASYAGPDTRRHNAPSTFQTREDAEAWLSARRGEIIGDTWRPPRADRNPMTLRRYADAWLENRRKADGSQLAPRTRAEYRRILDTLIYPELGDLPLRKLYPETVDAWYIDLQTGPTRKANAYALLHAILTTAVEQQRVTEVTLNPCQIRGAGRSPRASKTEPATLEELAAIVNKMPDRYKALVLLASWAALRFNELIGLRRRDIDVKAGKVHVRRGVNLVEGEFVVTGPKAGSIRTVAYPPHLDDAVKAHLRDHVEPGRDALLFPPRSGQGFLRESTLAKVYYPARLAAGRPDLRFHDLRHTGLTYAARSGATTAELMRRAGHKTVAASLIYQHASDERDREIAKRLSAMANGPE